MAYRYDDKTGEFIDSPEASEEQLRKIFDSVPSPSETVRFKSLIERPNSRPKKTSDGYDTSGRTPSFTNNSAPRRESGKDKFVEVVANIIGWLVAGLILWLAR